MLPSGSVEPIDVTEQASAVHVPAATAVGG